MRKGRVAVVALGILVVAVIAIHFRPPPQPATQTLSPVDTSVSAMHTKQAQSAIESRDASHEFATRLSAPPPVQADSDRKNKADAKTEAACALTTIGWLSQRSDAESLLAAATLSMSSTTGVSNRWHPTLTLLDRAISLTPDDPAIRWLALTACNEIKGCDASEHSTALQRIDPRNSAVWMNDLVRAVRIREQASEMEKKQSTAAVNDAFHAMAKGERFDFYWQESSSRATRTLETTPVAPPKDVESCTAVMQTASISANAGMPLPPLQLLIEECRLPQEPTRIADCAAISSALRNGDTIIAQLVGFKIANLVVQPNSREHQELKVSWRQFQWQYKKGQELLWDDLEALIQHRIRLEREARSEIDLLRAVLRENSIPLEPPAEWQPPPLT